MQYILNDRKPEEAIPSYFEKKRFLKQKQNYEKCQKMSSFSIEMFEFNFTKAEHIDIFRQIFPPSKKRYDEFCNI